MRLWTLDDLYTAISKQDLENLFGEIIPDRARNRAWQKISFACDKAQNVVMDMLCGSFTIDDFQNAAEGPGAPAIVKECISVQAAIYLSTESDMGDFKEKLLKRWTEAKKILMMLRDFRYNPKLAGGDQAGDSIVFGVVNG